LLLADDTLAFAGTDWDAVVKGCDQWLTTFRDHPRFPEMEKFEQSKFDRFNTDIKSVRNILPAIMGVEKPWEVLVGQAIATLNNQSERGANSLYCYLGTKLCAELLGIR